MAPAAAPAAYSRYVTIGNADETVSFQAPAEWADIEFGDWQYQGGVVGKYLAASTSLADLRGGKAVPGVVIGVFDAPQGRSVDGLLGTEGRGLGSRCTPNGRRGYADPFYTGSTDTYVRCGAGKHTVRVTAQRSGDGRSLALIVVNVVSAVDAEAADKVLATFQVLGDVEEHDHGHHDG
jgi:hypothetical protein